MKKNIIIVVVVLCVLIVSICLGIILVGLNNDENNSIEENVVKEENITSEETNNEIKEEIKEEKGENVVLESKIGSEILAKIFIPNIYSKLMYEELDKNGLSNDFKIMYTFSMMTNSQEYSQYLRQGEDYTGSYITDKDLQEVANNIFENADNLKHKPIFDESTYDEQTKDYVIVARGYAGIELDYVVEIPYEILEYRDKYEVKSYRVYLNRKYSTNIDEGLPTDEVYSDENKTNLLTSISDEKMLNEMNGQKEFLESKIEDGTIYKDSLQVSTWTIVKKGNDYLISDYNVE